MALTTVFLFSMWILYIVINLSSGVAVGSTEFNSEAECIAAMGEASEILDYDLRVSCWSLDKAIDDSYAIDKIK